METSDSLTTFAELAMALAGFTGLLTAFQRKHVIWSEQERFRIRMLLMVCFGIMVFALSPKMLVDSTMPEAWMWRFLTIGWSLFAIASCVSLIQRVVVGSIQLAMPKASWLLLIGGLAVHSVTLAGSVFLLWSPGSAALAAGFIWGLMFGGMFFYGTLAIIWRKEDAA